MHLLSLRTLRCPFLGIALGCLTISVQADAPPKTAKPADPKAVIYPTGYLRTPDWLKASVAPLAPGELDRLVNQQLKQANVEPAPRTTDEQFLRRAWLDLTGRLPMPADIKEFVADKDPNKRAKMIDQLLASDDFARHWALYWRDVINSRVTDPLIKVQFTANFEIWMTEQLKANRKWSDITRDIIAATGELRNTEVDKNGQAYFLISRRGADATTEIAAETSRIFLGIQIQCAQCHDHPSDVWKRKQFHEFAAYFARYRQFPIRDGMRIVGAEVKSIGFGEHRMPDKEDPKKGTVMQPRFIDGKAPEAKGFRGLSDLERRKALAEAVVSKQNPWFAGAFVNRIWGELMGQAFYQPIDDLGPEKEAFLPDVLARVAGSFRGADYDVKQLFRDLMTSETYQRQIRPGESPDQHLLFAAHSMAPLNANALWQSLVDTLGQMGPIPRPGPGFGPFARFAGLEATFKQEFGYDPSTKPAEVEGSVSQALLLMNNPTINQKIQAKGTNLLARILASYSEDDEALRMVYLRTLARRPTDRETARCREHLRTASSRAEGYEDILWALINSTEFQMKR